MLAMSTESLVYLDYVTRKTMSIENTFLTISCDHPDCNGCITIRLDTSLAIELPARLWRMVGDKHYCPKHAKFYLTPQD